MKTNEVTETIKTTELGCAGIEHRFGSGSETGMIDLKIFKETTGTERWMRYTGRIVVRWNVNRGKGWHAGWKAKFANETEAREFALSKWPILVAWLEKQTADASFNGAVAAFSAQVAGMRR